MKETLPTLQMAMARISHEICGLVLNVCFNSMVLRISPNSAAYTKHNQPAKRFDLDALCVTGPTGRAPHPTPFLTGASLMTVATVQFQLKSLEDVG